MLIIITHTLLSLLFPLLIGYSLYRVFRGHSSKKLPLKSGENLPSGKTVIGSAEGENYYYQYQAERRPGGRGRRGELAVLRVWVKTSQGGSFIAQAEEKGSFMLPP
ncbi:MAG: hypothetical protein Q7S00_02875, partial [bacterium]|nr:hypothetical protein [bacterium]